MEKTYCLFDKFSTRVNINENLKKIWKSDQLPKLEIGFENSPSTWT